MNSVITVTLHLIGVRVRVCIINTSSEIGNLCAKEFDAPDGQSCRVELSTKAHRNCLLDAPTVKKSVRTAGLLELLLQCKEEEEEEVECAAL